MSETDTIARNEVIANASNLYVAHTDNLYIARSGERVDVMTRDDDRLTSVVFGDSRHSMSAGWIGGYHVGVARGWTTEHDPENGSAWGSPFGLACWSDTHYVGDYDDWTIREDVRRAVELAAAHGVIVAVPPEMWFAE